MLAQITPTVSDADNPLPSAGTEAPPCAPTPSSHARATPACWCKTENEAAAERLMEVVRRCPTRSPSAIARLVIEDL